MDCDSTTSSTVENGGIGASLLSEGCSFPSSSRPLPPPWPPLPEPPEGGDAAAEGGVDDSSHGEVVFAGGCCESSGWGLEDGELAVMMIDGRV